MESNKKTRNSSFELIKIIAIICIIFCHSIPAERIEYHFATSDPWLFGVILFRQLGSIGNAIFIVASTWFLVDSDKTSLQKIKSMIADNQVISLIMLVIIWVGGYNVGIKESVKQAFPFLFSVLWYITCYVMYYCVHGFLNKALRGSNISSKIAMIVLFIFNGLFFILDGRLYFTELFGFVLIHAFTWYLKRITNDKNDCYLKKIGLRILVIGIVGWFLGAIFMNIVGVHVDFIGLKLQNWNRFYNPFILAISYGSILLASRKQCYSEIINKISGLSLYVYMITGNQLLRIYFDNDLYDIVRKQFGSSMMVCFWFVVVYTIIKLILGCLLACIYKLSLARLVGVITKKEVTIFENCLNKKTFRT